MKRHDSHMVLNGAAFCTAALLLVSCGDRYTAAPSSIGSGTWYAEQTSNARVLKAQHLYIGLAPNANTTGAIAEYRLPLKSGELPVFHIAQPTPTIGVAIDSAYFYITNYGVKMKSVKAYKRPGSAHERASAALTVTGAYALADAGGFLYVSTLSGTISSYATPLVNGEQPSATITGLNDSDGSGLAADSQYLYLANYGNGESGTGSLSSYKLPLSNNEAPAVVLSGLTGPIGAAVDTKSHLYVVCYGTQDVLMYSLPLTPGENPTTMLPLPAPGFGVALNATHLYVSDFSSQVWVYKLPISAGEKPALTLTNLAHPNGMAVGF